MAVFDQSMAWPIDNLPARRSGAHHCDHARHCWINWAFRTNIYFCGNLFRKVLVGPMVEIVVQHKFALFSLFAKACASLAPVTSTLTKRQDTKAPGALISGFLLQHWPHLNNFERGLAWRKACFFPRGLRVLSSCQLLADHL